VTLTAFGNKLVVISEDRAALALVSELVRLLTSNTATAGDFQIIRLKRANALEVAKLLDEAFNGFKSAGGGKGAKFGVPGGFEGLGGPGGGSPAQFAGNPAASRAREERTRVVADPATNALLIKASPLDFLTIRNMIEKQLDLGHADALVVVKTHAPIRLQNMHVTDAYSILRDLYRESTNNNARTGVIGGFAGALTGNTQAPALNIDANGNSRGVTLSMSYDNNTNSLIVACPTPMYDDIKKLVGQMDAVASANKQSVKFVRVPGVDPAVIQQALVAIQGRHLTSRNNTGYGGPGGIGNGAGMFGTGMAAGTVLGGGFGANGGFFPGGGVFNNPTFTPSGGGFGGGGFGGAAGGKGPNEP
jgi:hypothetical protein